MKVRNFSKTALALIFLMFTILSIAGFIALDEYKQGTVLLLSGIIAVTVFAAVFLFHSYIERAPRYIAALGVVIGVALRLIIIFSTNITPEADFARFMKTAQAFAGSGNFPEPDYIAAFPHILGYPLVLSGVFKIAGVSVLGAQLFNVFLGAISILLVFLIAEKIFGLTAGFISSLLYALFPDHAIAAAIPCAEPLFTALMLLACYIMSCIAQSQTKAKTLYLYVTLGICTGVLNIIRPVGSVLLIAVLIIHFAFLCTQQVKEKKQELASRLMIILVPVLILLVTFYVPNAVFKNMASSVLDQQVADNAPGWNFYVGMEPSTGGWSTQDFAQYTRLHGAGLSPNELQKTFWDMGVDRAKENFADGKMGSLIVTKFRRIWSVDRGMTYWLSQMDGEKTPLDANRKNIEFLSNMFWFAVLILAAVGTLCHIRSGGVTVWLCVLIIVGLVLLYLVLEANPRYHYPVDALVSVLAGGITGLSYMSLQKRKTKSERSEKPKVAKRKPTAR